MIYAGRGTAGRTARGSYLDVLDLQRPPFGLDPDPAFFYAEPTLMQRLDLLVHLAQFSDRILVITGPAGAGKTSVLQQFMSRAGEGWRPCAMDSTEVPHGNALLARLASCFGGAGKADSTAVDVPALIERWRALQSAGRHPMVIIDDAHKLNSGTLEALLNLAGDPAQTAARVRLILLGEESLLAQLARAGLDPERDHLVHTMALPVLTADQTGTYLAYRLAVAGYSGESPFAPTEARAIHKASGGLPGRINQLAHEHLEEYMTGADNSTSAARGRRLPRWAMIGLGVIVLGAVLWKQDAINRLFNPGSDNAQKTVPLTLPSQPAQPAQPAQPQEARRNSHSALLAPMPPDVGPGSGTPIDRNGTPASGAKSSPPAAESPKTNAESAAAGNHVSAAAPAAPSQPAPSTTPSEAGGAGPSGLPSVAPPTAAPSPSTASPAAPPPVTATAGNTPAASTAQPTPSAPSAKAVPPKAAPTTTPAQTQTPETTAKPEPTPKSSQPAAAKQAPPQTGGPSRADWLLRQNPRAYTLQLLGARDEASVRRFIRVHHLGKQAMYYTGDFKGAPWYVLLYGVYPDIEAAHKALAGLPPKVRKGGPWARRLSTVQKDIRQRRQAAR
ncbi:MAG: AAA family ATPase [Gammaproteobacteria bacterium]